MLKYSYATEGEIPTEHKAFYTEVGGKWVLQVEGAVPKEKLDEFRETNRKLLKDHEDLKKKFADIDPDEYVRLKTIETDLQAGKIKGTKAEEILEQRTAEMKKDHEKKIKESQDRIAILDTELAKLKITDAAIQEGTKKGLKPSAVEDLAFRAQAGFALRDGKVVALMPDGKERFNAQGEPFSIQDFVGDLVTKAPHLFEASAGGDAKGGGGGGGGGTTRNPWSKEHWNMTEQGKMVKTDRARAEKLAAAAGKPLPAAK